MPKKQRLTGSEIRRLKPEKRLNSSLFSLSYAAAAHSKCSCVVSKKVSPKAVVRNSVKRRMRSALRALSPLPSAAVVLTAKKPVIDTPYKELVADVEALMNRVRSGK